RMAPTTVQNVVTYTVLVNADNSDEKLLPGMTANVSFEITRYKDILKVPNSALRFVPPGLSPDEPAAAKNEGSGRGHGARGRVYVNAPTGPQAVAITTGATDGSTTQIIKGNLEDGQEIIVGLQKDAKKDTMLSNPFATRPASRPRAR